MDHVARQSRYADIQDSTEQILADKEKDPELPDAP